MATGGGQRRIEQRPAVRASAAISGALALFLAFSGTAAADPRIDITTMSCAEAADAVEAAGAAIVYYGPRLYKRIVTHRGHCERGEGTAPEHLPTRDEASCFVGYRCERRMRFPGRF
ncbi:hypothetical protein GGD81_000151 [Rhodobium orientis]|uniref:Uncharacterized protein n=1 Tax=Rhodobium orientis TaxID=34017 RepID=A0A327JU89_9HYPH|nr:hypothetical protein [Rhodobium orientis]MBB4301136.1 hypothetical protein [Rhodobium orientis]MBK5949800.1 hypothetical protein [Rhodobium orientis]RAI30090.1 hypothetical protein CH339_00735 [Rhodobium orientis]